MPMFEHYAQGIERLRRLYVIVGRDGPLCRLCALRGTVAEKRGQPGREAATNHLTSLHHHALLKTACQ
jgi:hypothetical protein